MTSVHIHLFEGDGTTDATGYVIATPTTRRDLSAGGVALPVGVAYTLVDGEATMTLAPSGLTWCWEVREMTAAGTTRYVSVTDSGTTLEYEDLPDVDPDTLVPWSPADPEAAYLAALWTAVDDYLTANPVDVPVTSVNGATGDVVLVIPDSPDDIGAAAATHAHADASETVKGLVELATTVEAAAGTDTARATTPAGVKAYVDGLSLSSTYAALTNHRRGSGSPVSVITPAAVGEVYADTAATCGARLWISTGTTVASWTVLDGDTGWRDISASVLTASWDATGLVGLRVRRVGGRVDAILQIKPADVLDGTTVATTWKDLVTIPAGFKPLAIFADETLGTASVASSGSASPATWAAIRSTTAGKLSIHAAALSAGNWADAFRVTSRISWVTAEAWPTTLPGTAV